LKHLDLWDFNPPEVWRVKVHPPSFWRARPPPKRRKSSQVTETIIDYSDAQLLPSDDYLFYDPDYPAEGGVYADPILFDTQA
jgi:hypothetical protein